MIAALNMDTEEDNINRYFLNPKESVGILNKGLIEEYNTTITNDEIQKQYLLQVVWDYRNKYPDSKKSTILHKKF
ncbi:unnamed protein product [Macrosiphum euphorbiae]|uniref:Uncharacterized protein n=1 Tax=Macrosiphum euphorbiae TaxID=13131 RepID=A0AAV0XV88_9HEMI|nr:unnamed protein product [Macrosiphum euphorbiae]